MGFNKVQTVERMGGVWYRRSQPYSPSKTMGLAYESWEAPGFTLWTDIVSWVGKGRATRLDATVDFPGVSMRPLEIRDMLRSGKLSTDCDEPTLVDGGNKGQTMYLGSSQSPRRLRIYEKGKQLGNDEDMLRVEVTLKQELAEDAFTDFDGKEDSYHAWISGQWRSHLERLMDGPLVQEWVKGLPAAELRTHTDDLDPWATVSAFAIQYGQLLVEMQAAGLLIPWVASMGTASRWSQRRIRGVMEVVASDVDRLMSVAKKRGRK